MTLMLTIDLDLNVEQRHICPLIPYQGQDQRSMPRSLPSQIVKTLPVLTKCFHFLYYKFGGKTWEWDHHDFCPQIWYFVISMPHKATLMTSSLKVYQIVYANIIKNATIQNQ